jgi:gamma-glutamylputrescine oxidase
VPTTPYWLAQPLPLVPTRMTSGPVDVVVVGGGVTGCSCALTLAERGLRVRLLEAAEVAGGASGRNGGFALRGGAPAYDEARARLGVDQARGLWQLTELALDRIEALAGDAFRRTGSLRLAIDEAELAAFRREYDALRRDGFEAEWADRLAAPLDGLFVGGLVHPVDGALDPARWVRRLAARAVAAGAEVAEGHPVAADGLDDLDCRAVVVATDGSIAVLLPELAPFVPAVRGQVLVTEPVAELVYGRPHYARGGYDYWQQLPDGRLVLGGRRDTSLAAERTSADETTPFIQDQLDAFAAQLLGGPVAVTHRWSGCWGETPDLLPLAGRVPGRDHVWVAGGYSGHGNVLGLACGDLVARAILGEDPPELALFDPARLEAATVAARPASG